MAVTVASIITNLDTYIRDTSNNSISAAERLQYITEATVWLQEELQNDLQNETYDLNYLDSVYKYKVTTAVADLFEAVDMRRAQDDHVISWSRKSPREVAEEIGQQSGESVYAIERHDNENYLLVNHDSKYHALIVESGDDLTANATWQVETTEQPSTQMITKKWTLLITLILHHGFSKYTFLTLLTLHQSLFTGVHPQLPTGQHQQQPILTVVLGLQDGIQ